MARLLNKYLQLLHIHPWKTQICTFGGLCSAGDIIAQMVVEKRTVQTFEIARVGRFAAFGFLLGGPLIRGWFLVLERTVRATKFAGLQKMLLDQTFFAPTLLTSFLVMMGGLQQKSVQEISTMYRRDFLQILLTSYCIWPWVQLVNFYLVPFQHRIMVVSVVALGWNTYLAWRANKPLETS